MTKKIVFTIKAPKSVGPYSQVVFSGDFVFVSGQILINPKTSKVVEGRIEIQTVQGLENLKGILESISMALGDIVKSSCFSVTLSTFNPLIRSSTNILRRILQYKLQYKPV